MNARKFKQHNQYVIITPADIANQCIDFGLMALEHAFESCVQSESDFFMNIAYLAYKKFKEANELNNLFDFKSFCEMVEEYNKREKIEEQIKVEWE